MGWLLPLPPPLGPGLWLPCDGPWNRSSSLSAKMSTGGLFL